MRPTSNPETALPFPAAVPAEHGAAIAGCVGAWRIRYRQGAADCVDGFDSSDAATEAACRLLDGGSDVIGIDAGQDERAIDRERLALIYAAWVRARYH
jgi:DNA-binding LacI/PurR family transcriptional regulator